jgi:hypothetical protein
MVDALVAADFPAGSTTTVAGAEVAPDSPTEDGSESKPELLTEVAFDFMATRAVQQSLRAREISPGSLVDRIPAAVRRLSHHPIFRPVVGLVGVLVVIAVGVMVLTPEPEVQIIEVHTAPAETVQPAPEKAEVEAPPGFQGSVLEVVHHNRVGSGYMTLAMDGIPVSSLGMAPLEGETESAVEKTLFVPTGPHTIEVRIVADSAGVDVSGTIQGEFTSGEGRRLQVDLNPETHALELRWAD